MNFVGLKTSNITAVLLNFNGIFENLDTISLIIVYNFTISNFFAFNVADISNDIIINGGIFCNLF